MAYGLHCIALRAPIAIVNDQRRTAVIGDTLGQLGHNGRERGAIFNDHAGFGILKPMVEKMIGLRRGLAKAQAIGVASHQYLFPARRVAAKLPDGQGVKKLIGNEKEGRLWQSACLDVMDYTGQRIGLEPAQSWRGFDHMDWQAVKARYSRRYAAQVLHQCASSG